MSDKLVEEAATYTASNKYKSPTTLPTAGFEPAIPARAVLGSTTTGMSQFIV
jgi:hypothetical protein